MLNGRRLAIARITLTTLTALPFVSTPARAAVTLVMQHGASEPSTIYLDGDRIRLENGNKNATSVIVDGAAKRIITINAQDKTYSEHSEEDMKRFRQQFEAQRAQLQERMKTMPPEQRKQMEGLMVGLPPAQAGKPAKPRDLKFEKLGQKKTINGFSCDMYRVLDNGAPFEEDCIAPWSAKIVQKSDIAGLRKFAEEMAKNLGGMGGAAGPQMFAQFDKYPGFPVSHVAAGPGQQEEDQLKSVKRGAVPATLFTVPAGYTKKESPMGPSPGAHRPNLQPLPPPKP